MSVEMACTCGGLPSHSHIFEPVTALAADGCRVAAMRDTGEVRIWVDWREVARALARESE